ncbi:hypothetical protein Tco_0875086 [Tanacetum coccineum]|uniref:Uncharacterized protein n=1 Tax=Tanacetum coccineum TaxID=301880 RepID=A0ABQ5BNI2_9ASTR
MPTSHTFVTSHARLFITYIILSNSEDEDATLSDVSAPLSLDHVLVLSGYSSNSESDSEPTEDDSADEELTETDEPLQAHTALTPFVQPPPTRPLPTISAIVFRPGQEIPLRRPYRLRPDGPLMMHTPRKRVRTPVALPSAIEAAISDEIDAPPRKRASLSSPSAALPSSSPLPSSSRKRSMSPSPPPLHCHHHYHQIDQEGAPSTYEIGESSIAHVLPMTSESVSLERIETLEQEVETMRNRAEIAEQRTEDLQDALGRAREEIVEH